MSAEHSIKSIIQAQIEGEKRAQEFIRKHQKGRGGVGFGDPNEDPLVMDTIPVVGRPYQVETKEGIKMIVPKARVVVLSDGSIDVVSGGIGAPISEAEALRILGKSEKRRLKKSLKTKKGVK